MKIRIAGLGAHDPSQMTIGVYETLLNAPALYMRTLQHPSATMIAEKRDTVYSFDEIYESADQFEEVYEAITARLLSEVKEKHDIVYAVPGHPLVAEASVKQLLEQGPLHNVQIEVIGGQSFLDSMFATLAIDPIDGFQLVDGMSFDWKSLDVQTHLFIMQVFNRFMASDVKLQLLEKWPPEAEVCVVTAAGSTEEVKAWVPLHELDHEDRFTDVTTLYLPPLNERTQRSRDFASLREIIATLRGPDGCPWDKKQTHASLKPFLLEETYEVWDAIDDEDDEHLADELGDILLQVLLHAQIGEDEGRFSLEDVVAALATKMIRRHPHVFGNEQNLTEEEIHSNWMRIKQEEKGELEHKTSRLDGIPAAASTLLQAYEIQKKAAKSGFDWDDAADVWKKVKEEIHELEEEFAGVEPSRREEEWGDTVFAFINIARHYNIQPEAALMKTVQKFNRRFRYIEQKVEGATKPFEEHTLDELDVYWEEAKKEEENK
ncbi:nucleoside triphosphate pyrophosphohydrolase [Aureibacillus halotolerans]|uniref:Tetrapyrrole methylase family protein/MazG family protein n=1 Tax=Aureibacillus halotolerans TaxID=1508390 RepID=A0A4R6TQP4_9BACI|nr:tetrapyrrole methylase family protein/MazG family protein [Aureibacillus halotolerans]